MCDIKTERGGGSSPDPGADPWPDLDTITDQTKKNWSSWCWHLWDKILQCVVVMNLMVWFFFFCLIQPLHGALIKTTLNMFDFYVQNQGCQHNSAEWMWKGFNQFSLRLNYFLIIEFWVTGTVHLKFTSLPWGSLTSSSLQHLMWLNSFKF